MFLHHLTRFEVLLVADSGLVEFGEEGVLVGEEEFGREDDVAHFAEDTEDEEIETQALLGCDGTTLVEVQVFVLFARDHEGLFTYFVLEFEAFDFDVFAVVLEVFNSF